MQCIAYSISINTGLFFVKERAAPSHLGRQHLGGVHFLGSSFLVRSVPDGAPATHRYPWLEA
jgi:hypothetical protein